MSTGSSVVANVAFVLGNGRSRLNIDVNLLPLFGTVYGCNALYREFSPRHLVAVDVKMINEIISTGYHLTHAVWTNPNSGVSSADNINFFDPHKGWSSGPTALWLAAQHNYTTIYILGFDYEGIEGKFNNVYADTVNYKKKIESATYHGNWLNQSHAVITEYRRTTFIRVVDNNPYIPSILHSAVRPNLTHIDYAQFCSLFSIETANSKICQKSTV